MTDYDALKAHGHAPAKAAEIILDAKRGDEYSADWIKMVRETLQLDKAAQSPEPKP